MWPITIAGKQSNKRGSNRRHHRFIILCYRYMQVTCFAIIRSECCYVDNVSTQMILRRRIVNSIRLVCVRVSLRSRIKLRGNRISFENISYINVREIDRDKTFINILGQALNKQIKKKKTSKKIREYLDMKNNIKQNKE